MPIALWALAIGAFGIGVTEFIIAGLLPLIAADFGVSVSAAGNLATFYALGVFIGAPLVTILGARAPRKGLLIGLTGLFILGNLITAAAPTLEIAILGRLVTALNHGAFFGIGAILAAEMVAPDKRARAIAFMFTGLSVANLIGVPLGTLLAQALSWRVTFVAIAGVGVATLIGIVALLPKSAAPEGNGMLREIAAFADRHVLLAMGITVFGSAAFFSSITYIAPMMLDLAGYSAGAIVWLMVLFGVGLFIGNILGGRFADKALMPTLYATQGGQAVVLTVFWLVAPSKVGAAICIFLMALLAFATISPVQKLVMDKARAAGAPTLASAVNIGMFNLGNALGAWLGGVVIALGLGLAAPNWAGAVMALIALGLALVAGRAERSAECLAQPAE